MKRTSLFAILVLCGAAILAGAGLRRGWFVEPSPESSTGTALIGGPFSLVDQNNQRRNDREFRGKFLLVYFGYTACPDACPLALQNLSEALRKLGGRADELQVVFVSVDPTHDTPAVLHEYMQHFDSRILALTGSQDEVSHAAAAYRVFVGKTPDRISHSDLIYVMGKDGSYLRHFSSESSPDEIVDNIKSLS
ncbi:MAG TPA: SCO family protein [Dongiaceae bacterium]|jgi:protein SCO1/2|nr:SCO family protein [Dongiaceae bacterium]